MSLEDDYEFVVAVKESSTYMGATVLERGVRILCGPCTRNEAEMFIDEAVKDGGFKEHYHLLARKIGAWKECLW